MVIFILSLGAAAFGMMALAALETGEVSQIKDDEKMICNVEFGSVISLISK